MKQENSNAITKDSNESKIRQQIHRTESDWNWIIDYINNFKVDRLTCPEEVYIKLAIPRKTFEDELNRNNALFDAYDSLKIRISIENEKYGKKKDLTMSTITGQSLSQLNPNRWPTKNDNQQNGGTRYIVLEKY